MNELQQLVRRFLNGELSYRQFRRAFGPIFSRSDADQSISRGCEWIESECSAFEHGIIDEMGLKLALNMNIAWPGVQPRNVANPVEKIRINNPVHLVITPNEASNEIARVRMVARVA